MAAGCHHNDLTKHEGKDAGKKRTVVELSLKGGQKGPRKEKKKRPKRKPCSNLLPS